MTTNVPAGAPSEPDESAGSGVTVRPARASELGRVAAMAGALVRMHNAADPRRFLLVDGVEAGYQKWFARELERPEHAVVVVAVRGNAPETIVGYAYGTLEGRDWNMLLDAHGALHDVFVDEAGRSRGAGQKLVTAMVQALETLGAKRVVLSTMVSNGAAQRLFARCGFRPTMLEMTR